MLQQRMNTRTADNDDVTQEKSHQQEDNDQLPDDENVISFSPPAGEWTELTGALDEESVRMAIKLTESSITSLVTVTQGADTIEDE